jgi:hypothetical protein
VVVLVHGEKFKQAIDNKNTPILAPLLS